MLLTHESVVDPPEMPYPSVRPWGTQTHFINCVVQGRALGILRHYVHKGRQTGITEICRILTAFLMQKYTGLLGAFIVDDRDNLEIMRTLFQEMCKAIPGMPALTNANEKQTAWENGSRLGQQYAGSREAKKKKLGVGRGIAFLHATEAPIWLQKNISAYLASALSKVHEFACAIFEGTARGKNDWFDIWTNADGEAQSQAIFCAPWLREDYALDLESDAGKMYWDGRLTARERRWVREVKRRYGFALSPEFLAWRRQYVAEDAKHDDRTADQEMPVLPEESFEATGISMVPFDTLKRCRRTIDGAPAATPWRYEFGLHIEDTQFKKTVPARADLLVWEEPQPHDAYVVAAVAAHTSYHDDPQFVIHVARGNRDALIQVAEFTSEDCGMQPFAWVGAQLATAYGARGRAFILDAYGIGGGVLDELKRLKASGWGTANRKSVAALLGGIRHYYWYRPDSLVGTPALQWQSTPTELARVLYRLRDQLVNGAVVLRSEHCARELERMRLENGVFTPEGGEATAHHLVAAALATEAWSKQLRPIFEREQGRSNASTVLQRTVGEFFDRLRSQPTGARR